MRSGDPHLLFENTQRLAPSTLPILPHSTKSHHSGPSIHSFPNLTPPRRHASLKHLLNLDSYDFVTDVNVAEAQVGLGVNTQ